MRILIGTRFWSTSRDTVQIAADVSRLSGFIDRTSEIELDNVEIITVVAVNVDADTAETGKHIRDGVERLDIRDWSVSRSLNAMTAFAMRRECDFVTFISVDVVAHAGHIAALIAAHDDNRTLVAGAALTGHDIDLSIESLSISGTNNPFNTLAMWHVNSIAVTGFLPIADALSPPGQEEVPTIALIQLIDDNAADNHSQRIRSAAKLVVFDEPIAWTVHNAHSAAHALKMSSKGRRAAELMRLLNIRSGRVTHIRDRRRIAAI